MAATDTLFDLRPSSHSAFSAGEYAFADAGNLEHCAWYLNQTLVTFGFPASLDLFASDPVSIDRTCNCLYSLLQQRRMQRGRDSPKAKSKRLLG